MYKMAIEIDPHPDVQVGELISVNNGVVHWQRKVGDNTYIEAFTTLADVRAIRRLDE